MARMMPVRLGFPKALDRQPNSGVSLSPSVRSRCYELGAPNVRLGFGSALVCAISTHVFHL